MADEYAEQEAQDIRQSGGGNLGLVELHEPGRELKEPIA